MRVLVLLVVVLLDRGADRGGGGSITSSDISGVLLQR